MFFRPVLGYKNGQNGRSGGVQEGFSDGQGYGRGGTRSGILG